MVKYLGYIYFYDENLKDDAKAYEYLKAAADGEYEQRIGDTRYTLSRGGNTFAGYRDGKELFSATAGVRVVTDLAGNIRALIGLDGGAVRLCTGGKTRFEGELAADGCIRFGA